MILTLERKPISLDLRQQREQQKNDILQGVMDLVSITIVVVISLQGIT